jgi:ATP-dependent exoDNAse (exonuclease V) alpha subunit
LANEARARQLRDEAEVEDLIQRHLIERRALDRETTLDQLKDLFAESLQHHSGDTGKAYALDPARPLVLPPDENAIPANRIRQNPSLVIDEIARHEANFTRSDILRRLARHIDDPLELRIACDAALRSDELVAVDDQGESRFTTRNYRKAESELLAQTTELATIGRFKVSERNSEKAIAGFNAVLRKRYGSSLTEEQCLAIRHLLSPKQLHAVVGWAGTGKSTMLQVAKGAWERQGYNVYGLALAVKAADSLENAAGISSRTLASLEASWIAGYEPIDTGSVVVLDEAGMVGTHQLNRIVEGLRQRGCKLVLVGDPDQLQPIEAGTPFRIISKRLAQRN